MRRSYIDNASKRLGFPNGSTGPERNAFNFYQATQPEDFDNSRWAPGPSRAHEILSSILAEAPGRRTLHERHMHFLDPEGLRRERAAAAAANGSSSSGRNLVYINLLRDPGALRASSFYFARDCICMQRPAYNYTIRNSSWYEIQDEWCKTEWHRKSEALCATDVNSCYADLDSCRRTFPADALGGTVELDFMCGTHADCADDQPIEVKFSRALRNLRDSYLWVGVLERLQDSLRLLQTLLPEYFGHMNASHWAHAHFQPDHVASEHGAPASSEDPAAAPTGGSAPPSAETIAIMRRDPHMRAEFELYERANDVLNCKLQGCGLAGGGGGSGRMLSEDRRTDGGSSIGATWPTIVESTVMAARAPTAPNQTVKRGWRMDMMAAMKKVLSPSSVPKITPMEAVNASANPAIPKVAAATTVSSASAIGRSTSATAKSVLLCIVLADPPRTPRARCHHTKLSFLWLSPPPTLAILYEPRAPVP